jgi:multiple sugar transport system substrate-binding protein
MNERKANGGTGCKRIQIINCLNKFAVVPICAMALAFTGCGQESGREETGTPSGEGTAGFDSGKPVKLGFYMDLGLSDEWIHKFIIDPVQKRYPNITMEIVRKQKGSNPDELVAAGNFPDIWYTSTPWLSTYQDLNLLYDMRDLIKKNNFDLGKLNPAPLDAIRQWGTQGEIYGLPLWMNYEVLYYNKDIFDKFGVPYPRDGMTWDDALQLSRALSRTDNGIQYRGLDSSLTDVYSQLSQPYVDSKTNRALLESDGFKKVYRLFLDMYQIPGNEKAQRKAWGKDAFLRDRVLAMWPFYADMPTWINDMAAKGEAINWDMAQMPGWPDRPGISWQVDSHNLHIAGSSPNKEAAFQVISYLLTKEPQLELERNGLLSVLTDPEMNKHFGESMTIFNGKHIEAIFKSKPAPKYPMTKYDSIAMDEFNKAFNDVEAGNKDINTALRAANESANQKIQEKLAAAGK